MPPHRVQIRPANRTFKTSKVRISECRGHAYPQTTRELAVAARLLGNEDDNNFVEEMRELGLYPSERTVDDWMARFVQFGHARAFRRTGNRRATREVQGVNLVTQMSFQPSVSTSFCATLDFDTDT